MNTGNDAAVVQKKTEECFRENARKISDFLDGVAVDGSGNAGIRR